MVSILPKALVAILAPYMDIPRIYLEPLREIIVDRPWCGGRGRHRHSEKQMAVSPDIKKKEEDPIEIITNLRSSNSKARAFLRPADIV